MSQEQVPFARIDYAAPTSKGGRVWPAVAILFAGLGLIGLGGCFLIGVMMMVTGQFGGAQPSPLVWTPAAYTLLGTLYFMAFTCFGGATLMMFLGVKGLLLWLR